MKILLYSHTTAETVADSLGIAEYSYYFVLKEFRALLADVGSIEIVAAPLVDADRCYDSCLAQGQQCVLFAFSPPHKMPIPQRCPVICVFAWEFSNLPAEQWGVNWQDNWVAVLRKIGGAITHSQFMADIVRAELGADFPIVSIPAPLWDRFAAQRLPSRLLADEQGVPIAGMLLDTRDLDFAGLAARRMTQSAPPLTSAAPTLRYRLAVTKRHLLQWYRDALSDLVPPLLADCFALPLRAVGALLRTAIDSAPKPDDAPRPRYAFARQDFLPKPVTPLERTMQSTDTAADIATAELRLSGVVYTAIFNPCDSRKNWQDILSAFCWVFRDNEQATLVLKLTHHDTDLALPQLLDALCEHQPYRCRVVLIDGYLSEQGYSDLIRATTYIVNASHGEGQCLPLMEYMSSGRPAIAPNTTALADYIDTEVAFVVASTLEASHWPHDSRQAYRTLRYRIDWQTLVDAYRDSFRVFVEQPELYRRMSERSVQRLREHCSRALLRERLQRFIAARFNGDQPRSNAT